MKKQNISIIILSALSAVILTFLIFSYFINIKNIKILEHKIYYLEDKRDSLNNVITNSVFIFKKKQGIIDSLSLANQALRTDEFYMLISLDKQHFWVKKRDKIIWEGPCATGRGRTVIDRDTFDFSTPIGERTVWGKKEEPFWTRPNWYWIEKGLEVPPDSEIITIPDTLDFQQAIAFYDSLLEEEKIMVRRVPGALGKSLLNLSDGILIHQGNIGAGIHSHGCIRLKSRDLEIVDSLLPYGTSVFIF